MINTIIHKKWAAWHTITKGHNKIAEIRPPPIYLMGCVMATTLAALVSITMAPLVNWKIFNVQTFTALCSIAS